MPLRIRWLAVAQAFAALAVGVVVFIVIVGKPLTPPSPPLLQRLNDVSSNATLYHAGCPPWDWDSRDQPGSIEERLMRTFPSGTAQDQLTRALAQQGFTVDEPCASDPTVKTATFRQTGGGPFGPFPAWSYVTWKVDPSDRIVWVTGRVAYTGM